MITKYTGSEKVSNVADTAYPVGSIYMSVNSTSPATLFGGTWEQIKDRFLLSAGDTYTAGSTGGEATHTLTVDEMPRHNHRVQAPNYNTANTTVTQAGIVLSQGNAWVQPGANNTNGDVFADVAANAATFTGGGQAHNNMPPYLAVYMWRRIA